MSDANKLSGIPFKMLRMDDERTGLSDEQIAIWKATHPETTYQTVPTSQEVADKTDECPCPCPCHRGDVGSCMCSCDDSTDSTADIVTVTEEARLRRLLTSWCKAVLEYFSNATK